MQTLTAPADRIASVDAYRGLVMLLMLAEVLRSCTVSAAVPSSSVWGLVCYEQSHVQWVGATLHDLIQPSFYFLVGIGLALSLSRRRESGQTTSAMVRHAVLRSAVLVVLGMALTAVHPRQWTWAFDNTLTHIGLAYPFLFAIAQRPRRDWYVALVAILIGYWMLFALFPLPAPGFDYRSVGVSPEWLNAYGLKGFAEHWQKNSNVAWAFDSWFLNLFPRDTPYTGAENGLTTLNFIPSIGTMILGLIAGDAIARNRGAFLRTGLSLLVAAAALLGAGWILGTSGVAPVVKAIWTPSWVVFSGGWCFLMLATFHGLVDCLDLKRPAFPLMVIGVNALAAYSLSHLYPALAFGTLRRVFGPQTFQVLGAAYEPALYGLAVLLLYWLVLYTLYRLHTFVRI